MSVPATTINPIGPFGSKKDGKQWDDEITDGIKEIIVSYGKTIESIQVVYLDAGGEVWGERHGAPVDQTDKTDKTVKTSKIVDTEKVTLEPPYEHLKKVTGHWSKFSDSEVICSLEFETNKQKHGPFGTPAGKKFAFPSSEATIVGFSGRSSDTALNAIGGYVKYTN